MLTELLSLESEFQGQVSLQFFFVCLVDHLQDVRVDVCDVEGTSEPEPARLKTVFIKLAG